MDDQTLEAFESVIAVLKPLDGAARLRVLNSVAAILGIDAQTALRGTKTAVPEGAPPPAEGRPLSLIELLKDIDDPTMPQLITAFAYYRDKYEGIPRFSKNDLKDYFARARRSPPGNYDRDFGNAVKSAWIHEDEDESYITTRGVEAVESGFAGERRGRRPSAGDRRSPKQPRREAKKGRTVKPRTRAATTRSARDQPRR